MGGGQTLLPLFSRMVLGISFKSMRKYEGGGSSKSSEKEGVPKKLSSPPPLL